MKIILLIVFFTFVYSAEYSVIVFSTVKYNEQALKKFIKRFPNGVVKRYSKFIEYKIEPFSSYKEAKKFIKKVKKYYKYPLIVKYNPKLGKIIYPKIKLIKKRKKNCLPDCFDSEKCKKALPWEYNLTNLYEKINPKVKNYLDDIVIKKTVIPVKTKENQTNIVTKNKNLFKYYTDLYMNFFKGQKDTFSDLKGYGYNMKLGFIYDKLFGNWEFYTDDRIIFTAKDLNGSSSNDFYLDINELYFRSYGLFNDRADILIGRKKTKDFKSWWFDNELDQIKLFSENYLLNYEVIFATALNNKFMSDNNSILSGLKNSFYLISNINYEYYYQKKIIVRYIYENLPKEYRKNNYVGIEWKNRMKKWFVWINYSLLKGKNKKNLTKYNSYAFDIGVSYNLYGNILACSFAKGGEDYFQPYIADNYSDFLGNDIKFKYYGNVFEPKLHNINIYSFYWLRDKFVLSFHNYKKINTYKTILKNDGYILSMKGRKNIGNELDFVYQLKKDLQYKFKIGVGYFQGNDAFKGIMKKNTYRIFGIYRYYWK